jgi:hypothetical protein
MACVEGFVAKSPRARKKNWRAVEQGGPGRWCDVFKIRDWKIQRVFIYLDPDYARQRHGALSWFSKK